MKTKNDSQLQRDVLDELEWEPSINASDIGVAVKDGIVTLSGSVPSYAEKRAAERAALRVSGVKGVAEEIKVRLPSKYQRTDSEIASAALSAIRWHVFLPEDQIQVKVENGWVTLEGEVEWNYQRARAESAVRPLTGVRGVTNLIMMKPQVKPTQIREKIKRALERAADEDAGQIRVEVDGSEVTLSGSVRSYMEKDEAEWAAWSAPGVTKVRNQLHVKVPMPAY